MATEWFKTQLQHPISTADIHAQCGTPQSSHICANHRHAVQIPLCLLQKHWQLHKEVSHRAPPATRNNSYLTENLFLVLSLDETSLPRHCWCSLFAGVSCTIVLDGFLRRPSRSEIKCGENIYKRKQQKIKYKNHEHCSADAIISGWCFYVHFILTGGGCAGVCVVSFNSTIIVHMVHSMAEAAIRARSTKKTLTVEKVDIINERRV